MTLEGCVGILMQACPLGAPQAAYQTASVINLLSKDLQLRASCLIYLHFLEIFTDSLRWTLRNCPYKANTSRLCRNGWAK